MPFVLDFDEQWRRPTKRRRLVHQQDMARTLDEDECSPEREVQNGHSQDSQHQPLRRDSQEEIRTSDREELIQCIKRGQRPTWVPKPNLEALCADTSAQAQVASTSNKAEASILCKTSDVKLATLDDRPDPISRPPSALHAGDFHIPSNTPSGNHGHGFAHLPQTFYGVSPHFWATEIAYSSPPRTISDTSSITPTAFSQRQRSRAPSLGSSLSSSFVMRVPTSPLVHATSSPGAEINEEQLPSDRNSVLDKASRRRITPSHTLTQVSLLSVPSTSVPSVKREISAPYRTHQIRRSLTSFTYQPAPSSQTVFPSRNRRLSHASETSPRQRTSMVGSFEESILRGTMSTPPSKPLDFVAQIGVLGKGDCTAKLKCPAHVSVPFPAVFYNYPTVNSSRSLSDDNPSPYVGTIDLQTNLKPVEGPVKRKRQAETNDPDALIAEITGPGNTTVGRALAAQKAKKGPARAVDCSAIGGAYRVPQQGQLQVVIKNPNKTAVKLFLVPYDLEGMKPGTKTFVRQRSFSSGAVVENALSANPERSAIQDPLSGKQILRYLIHLKFCCPSKGRFYVYDNIRIVFANRVPEGKEKLRNEVQLPEPKYSPFTPGSSSYRRQGIGDALSGPPSAHMAESFDMLDALSSNIAMDQACRAFASAPVPFNLVRSSSDQSQAGAQIQKHGQTKVDHLGVQPTQSSQRDASNGNSNKLTRPQSPEVYGFGKASTSQRGSPVPWASIGQSISRTSSPTPTANGDGLLSRKLREYGRQTGNQDV